MITLKIMNFQYCLKTYQSKVDQKDNETVSQIKDVLDNKIRPAVAKDSGDIKFILSKMVGKSETPEAVLVVLVH